MSSPRLLIVDDERIALRNLEHVMRKEGYEVTATQSGANALALLDSQSFDLVLTDLRMEKVDGMQVLHRCRERHPDTEVVLITGYATLETAVESMRQGAFYYVAKPYRLEEVRKVAAEALEKVRLKQENRALRASLREGIGKGGILTQNPAMEALLTIAGQVAPTDCNILITGESGVGKELLARFVHQHSGRSSGPFVAVNCGALTEELLGSELFGHVKGAFTGASGDKIGLIQAAAKGTLFLDEVTEMSAGMQVRLLRVLQEREVQPVGSNHPVPVDVRFVAATNRDVQGEVREGRFRQDLYYRINVVTLRIPPLAERRDDIPLLAHFFLKKFVLLMRKDIHGIAPEALALLQGYDFPGNVRELENLIERAVALCQGDTLESGHLPESLRDSSVLTFRKREGRVPSLEEQEREYVLWVLDEANGNRSQAAKLLGIDRVSLWRKLKRYGLAAGDET